MAEVSNRWKRQLRNEDAVHVLEQLVDAEQLQNTIVAAAHALGHEPPPPSLTPVLFALKAGPARLGEIAERACLDPHRLGERLRRYLGTIEKQEENGERAKPYIKRSEEGEVGKYALTRYGHALVNRVAGTARFNERLEEATIVVAR